MEETNLQNEIVRDNTSGFNSSSNKTKSGGAKWLIIFIILLILGGAGIYFFTKSANEPIATPTPAFNVTPIEDKSTATPVASSTPAPTDREDVSIEIQNGTGIPGEAKLLSDKLKALGYSDITAGNASSTDNTDTTVTFSKSSSQAVQDEIKKELESFYKQVVVKTSSTQKSDVVIVTGLRSSQTNRPGASSTPRTSSTSRATSTATSSGTPRATATSASN